MDNRWAPYKKNILLDNYYFSQRTLMEIEKKCMKNWVDNKHEYYCGWVEVRKVISNEVMLWYVMLWYDMIWYDMLCYVMLCLV